MMTLVRERLGIFSSSSFKIYFFGTTISQLGTGMQFIANSWLAIEMTKANYSVALVLICSAIPGILLSPAIGVYVDRMDRKLLASAMDVFRAIILLFVALLWWLGLLQAWHLYLMAFLVAMGDEIHKGSIRALICEVVPKKDLLSANSTTSIANQIGSVVGAGSAGALIALFSPTIIMLINACSFFVAAICTLNMRRKRIEPTAQTNKIKGWRSFFKESKEGFSYIQLHPNLIPKYLILFFLIGTLRTINVLLAPFAKNVLQVGAEGFGYIDAAFAAGAILGGLLLPVISRSFGTNRIMIAGVWALAASLLFFALSPSLKMAVIGYFLIGVTFQVWILYLTSAQENTDPSFLGRVHSAFTIFISIASLLIYSVMGFLGEFFSQRWLYGFQGVLVAVAGLLAYYLLDRKEENRYV